jgi:O-antigen/teichoic acid export membrane protein
LNPIKKLAGQTVIYGLSSIVPRFLSYFLVPLYTHVFEPDKYGIVADLYGLVVILNIVLTYGLETAYFWFSKNEKEADRVYSTSLISLISTSSIFILLTIFFAQPVANYLQYPTHPEYIWWFGIIIGVDSLCAIPFVKLRRENKAMKFASIKLFSVILNVLLTILFIVVFPLMEKHGIVLPRILYSPNIGVGYIFIANIISSLATLILLYKDFDVKLRFDVALWRRMLVYALPLLVAGLAGGINDAIDRQFLKFMLPHNVNAMAHLGIYFANMKIAVILVVFIQTFRFAAEPFFFGYEKEKDSREVFADIMKYFVIFCLIIFIGTQANLSWIKYFVGSKYWLGLGIVPLMLLSNLFVGIYLNLSIWYKLSGKTLYGAYIILIGSALTILINYLFVPTYGFWASSYARLVCYVIMTVICYILGQKFYPIPYKLKEISLYFLISMCFLIPFHFLSGYHASIQVLINNTLLAVFIYFILKREKLFGVLMRNLKKGFRFKIAPSEAEL